MLIGLDLSDLHYFHRDIRRKPWELISKLKPLAILPNFFIRGQEDRNDIDNILRSFEKNVNTPSENVFRSNDEQMALSKVKQSYEFMDGHYEVKLPWRDDTRLLPNNDNMT